MFLARGPMKGCTQGAYAQISKKNLTTVIESGSRQQEIIKPAFEAKAAKIARPEQT
jgi:hypothetical protein